jgi:flagellar biosynthesis/type III secretory pathway protein FliH
MLPGSGLTLVVHPSHADALRARLAAMARHASESGEPTPSFELRADPACTLDSCRIETEFGSVDASLNAQLNRLADAWGVSERP